MRRNVSMAAVFVGGLIALGSVHAQVPTGSIAGRIVDPTGEAIPGAQLLLTDTATSCGPQKFRAGGPWAE